MEEFVGNGSLKELLPRLIEEGWDDVPALKIINSEDMDEIGMSQQHKDALEIRSYLHDRALLQYGDKLEASGKCLPELLSLSVADLSSQLEMKRGHIARFLDRTSACATDPPPVSHSSITTRRNTMVSSNSIYRKDLSSLNSGKLKSMTRTPGSNSSYNLPLEQSMASFKIKEGHVFKGIVAAIPADPTACGCVQPPPILKSVAPYSIIENISVQKLTPEYKIGMEQLVKTPYSIIENISVQKLTPEYKIGMEQLVKTPYSIIENISVQKLTPEYKIGMEQLVKTKTPPMKSSESWREKPAILLCIRRPGCIMCRAEAHQLYSKKSIFDALGIQLYAVLHEQIATEVKDFWPRYWGGVVLFDRGKEFFKALGGGKLLKGKFISGFLFNPRAIANYKRAKTIAVDQNFKGEGEIKGGLFIVGRGKSGIAYQFIERNFGDWAPLDEVIEICTRLQNNEHQSIGVNKII